MIDRLLPSGGGMPAASADGTKALAAPRWVLPPRITWATTLLIALGTAAYLHETEGASASLFASAILGTLGALLVVLFRRVVPAVVLVSAIVAIICVASHVKQQTTEVLLHAFDVVSLLSSWSALSHFAREHREHALGLLVAVVATAILTWMALRIDGTRIRRAPACVAAVTFFVLATLVSMAKGERRHTEFYFENVYVSFFLASWSETIEALWRGALIEGAPNSPARARQNTATVCEPRPKPPHIILIHQESVVPPSHFPTLSYDRNLDPFFHSYDGQLRKLRVETFGGASWLTEFSVLTGLSTYSFGGMRQFVQQIMAGKVKDSLPHALSRCGYRNVLFYPMLRRFLGVGTFFEAVGLHEIYDAKDQGATLPNERDRFYYANLLAEIGRHLAAARTLLGLPASTTIEKVMESKNEAALTTYYAIDAVRYQPPPLPAVDSLDVPYLGTIVLEAARLPLSDSYRARRRLMLLCKGRYHDCPAKDEILEFQRRLIDAGLVDAR